MSEQLLDDDGENRAVRSFLMHYGAPGLTVKQMRDNMRRAGWGGCWPGWVPDVDGHLTKGGAQLWLRYLFGLEQFAPPRPLIKGQTELNQFTAGVEEYRRSGPGTDGVTGTSGGEHG